MRILVDARKIQDGGIGRYTLSLLQALQQQRKQKNSQQEISSITALINPSQRSLLPDGVIPLVTTLRPFSLRSFFSLARQIPWECFDLFHVPHFFVPRWPDRTPPIPTIATVHDIIPISHPDNPLHQRVMYYLLSSLNTQATKVITVSEASQRGLRDILGVAAAVVPNFLPDALWPPRSSAERSIGDYALCVLSNAKAHKGAAVFAEACRIAGVRGVAVGKGAAQLIGHPHIDVASEVPWEELQTLYRSARVLVVASKVEGFCLPAMEAKALGVPVVSTPEPAVLEFLDEHDQVAADFSAQALAQALTKRFPIDSHQINPQSAYRWVSGERFLSQHVAKRLLAVYHSCLS